VEHSTRRIGAGRDRFQVEGWVGPFTGFNRDAPTDWNAAEDSLFRHGFQTNRRRRRAPHGVSARRRANGVRPDGFSYGLAMGISLFLSSVGL
jgi:hypothetical protein